MLELRWSGAPLQKLPFTQVISGKRETSCAVSRAQEEEQGAHVSVTIPTLSVCSGKDCVLGGLVNGVSANILVDTGAATTVLSKDMWERSKKQGATLQGITNRKLVGVQGTPLHLYGGTCIQLELPPEKFQVNVVVADTPTADVILGRDFLRGQKCTIEMKESRDILHVQSRGQSVALAQDGTVDSLNVILQESVVVPPCSEMEVMARTPDVAKQKTWIVQGRESKRCAVMVARALVEPEENLIPVRLLNPRDVEVSVSRGTILAELESVPETQSISAISQDCESEPSPEHRRKLWEMVEGAEQSLTEEEKSQLFALLLEYHMLFATGDDDLGRTAKVQHRIDTANSPPIRQSVRRMPQFCRQEAFSMTC